jgi:predicted transcriptional regulator
MEENVEHGPLLQVGARVPRELAAAIAHLADEGDRSVSREIRRAIQKHVEESGSTASAPQAGGRFPEGSPPPAGAAEQGRP